MECRLPLRPQSTGRMLPTACRMTVCAEYQSTLIFGCHLVTAMFPDSAGHFHDYLSPNAIQHLFISNSNQVQIQKSPSNSCVHLKIRFVTMVVCIPQPLVPASNQPAKVLLCEYERQSPVLGFGNFRSGYDDTHAVSYLQMRT